MKFKLFNKSIFFIFFDNFFNNFFLYIIKFLKNLSAKYYQENKERLQRKACERYQNLSEEEKVKKCQHGFEHYKNLSGEEEQKLVEYRKQ